ncbi:hypothetical protein JCM11491_005605 [Sporobolomyces phaffii]
MPFPLAAKLVAGSLSVATAGLVASKSNTVLAESTASPFLRPESVEQHRSKLPLYEQQSVPVTLIPEKSPFQDEVAQVRAVVHDATRGLRSSTADGRAAWLGWERKAEDSLQRIISPQDQLNPGAMYVAIATLGGSILGRNRNILARVALPPVFFLLSLNYFLPHTSSNLKRKAEFLESAHFPQVRTAREKISAIVEGK